MKLHITTTTPSTFNSKGEPRNQPHLPRHEIELEFPATGAGASFFDEVQQLIDWLTEAKERRGQSLHGGWEPVCVPISVADITHTVKHEET